jgi:hypothetical protein
MAVKLTTGATEHVATAFSLRVDGVVLALDEDGSLDRLNLNLKGLGEGLSDLRIDSSDGSDLELRLLVDEMAEEVLSFPLMDGLTFAMNAAQQPCVYQAPQGLFLACLQGVWSPRRGKTRGDLLVGTKAELARLFITSFEPPEVVTIGPRSRLSSLAL